MKLNVVVCGFAVTAIIFVAPTIASAASPNTGAERSVATAVIRPRTGGRPLRGVPAFPGRGGEGTSIAVPAGMRRAASATPSCIDREDLMKQHLCGRAWMGVCGAGAHARCHRLCCGAGTSAKNAAACNTPRSNKAAGAGFGGDRSQNREPANVAKRPTSLGSAARGRQPTLHRAASAEVSTG